MLISYLDWQELEHYLDDFIVIITAILAPAENLAKHRGYRLLTVWVYLVKTIKTTWVLLYRSLVLRLTNLFMARIRLDELQRARDATGEALFK